MVKKEVFLEDWGPKELNFQGPEDEQTMVHLGSSKATKEKRDEIRKAGRGCRRSASGTVGSLGGV